MPSCQERNRKNISLKICELLFIIRIYNWIVKVVKYFVNNFLCKIDVSDSNLLKCGILWIIISQRYKNYSLMTECYANIWKTYFKKNWWKWFFDNTFFRYYQRCSKISDIILSRTEVIHLYLISVIFLFVNPSETL